MRNMVFPWSQSISLQDTSGLQREKQSADSAQTWHTTSSSGDQREHHQ